MDFEHENNQSVPIDPQPTPPIYNPNMGGPATAQKRKGTGWRIFWGIVLALSFMANVALFFMLIGVVAIFATGQRGILDEEIIRAGPSRTKIAMISVQGKRVKTLAPDLAEPYFGLGVAYTILNRNEEAIQAFEDFLERDTGQDPRASQEAQRYLKTLQGE